MSDGEEEREPQIDWHGDGDGGGFFGCVAAAGAMFLILLGGTCAYMGFSGGMMLMGLFGLALLVIGLKAFYR